MNIAMTQPMPTMIALTVFSLVAAYFIGRVTNKGEAKELRNFRKVVAVCVVVFIQTLLWQVTQHAPAKHVREYDKPVEEFIGPPQLAPITQPRIEAVQSFEDKLNEMRKRNEEE